MKCRPLYPAVGRGNQVRVLNDPVTVTEEQPLGIPLYVSFFRHDEPKGPGGSAAARRRNGQYEKGRGSGDSGVRKPASYGEVKLPCKV